jgi:excinuclease ABC subunit C
MFDIQEELKKLPEKPGIYIMKDENKNIIYIGKAIVLKNRVKQYFQSMVNQTPKTRLMVSKICEFEYIVTGTELEALILECTLIKKYKPKFNILLKDDKNYYVYIKITMNEEYPRVIMTRKILKDDAKYFGPYGSADVRETISLLKKLFPIKTCNKELPRDIGKTRPCLNYYIYQCMGPCQGDINKDEYRALMKDIASFIGGKQDDVLKRLEKQMAIYSENMEYERAASIRDKIESLKRISEKQKVFSTNMKDQDIVAIAKNETDSCIQVFFIRGGKLVGREHFIFEGVGEVEDKELMESFIKQYYTTAAFVPEEIVLQTEIEEQDIIEKWLTDKKGGRVHILIPKRGEKLNLIDMVIENAVLSLNQFKEKIKREGSVSRDGLKMLSEVLGLKELPKRIEAYDISNTGTSEMVGSMIVFEDGMASNREYRKFIIKSQDNQNDYGSMQEVVYRRFKHAEKERNERMVQGDSSPAPLDKFIKMPDLILVDGGLGHVNAISEVLSQMNINIPLYGMVKDDKHRTRGLVSKGSEIDLSKNLYLLRFVTAIQDEAHRFAIQFNKKLRSKRYEKSVLDEIIGIGAKRKKALIKHFGSVNKIKTAGEHDLLAVEGITKNVAQKIYNHFNG